ncbi:Carotenogenesis protein CarS [Myxococcus xanthus]|uniref:Carotenogenesis protein CarS n=1 Tax=Myxococcus xanthus TaxID=34 RepID=A0AAE6KT85_MYXXA|nr:Carotenogenesis protein CarS [Myxococcus xanthus]QDE69097.1 Carotenogenesis protein CarS [Myxococcus xanthus]QDE76373.1 Carotenogenesis protein CarS [Myxococcus xanthus]QDE83798.1 Carotenogenesis protein CarS [Myxococcus xanthus]QDE97926.1 Carotenogenesis protein CarS [Myxococcus xanthus]QDF05624.1 Carotenogenesis protein CarS [Myxococcus xanthus]
MIQDPSLIICHDVDGAPVRIGATVKVVPHSEDGTISQRFLGKTGIVVGLVFDDPATQYPDDPLIQVLVEGLGEDLFFPEELELAPEWARNRIAQHRQAVRAGGRSSLERMP